MKKELVIIAAALFILVPCCTKETKDYVYLGQMYNTFGHPSQERIKGKVKEFKQTHFWAEEADGKVIKGKAITAEDRKTTPLGRDMSEEYNSDGTVLRSISFNDNGKIYQDIKVDTDGKLVKKAGYVMDDTVFVYALFKYAGNRVVEATAHRTVNDTLIMSVKREYDQYGFISKLLTFSNKNEPTGYNVYSHNVKGLLLQTKSFSKDNKQTYQYDYTYDEKGNRITHHQQNLSTGQVIDYSFKYEYDKVGNYTAIIFIKDGKPFIYRAREIKYFE